MATIHIDEQQRIILPTEILEKAGLEPGDTLEIDYVGGAVILNPVKDSALSDVSIMQFAGSCKGAWGETPEEIEATLAADRTSWDR